MERRATVVVMPTSHAHWALQSLSIAMPSGCGHGRSHRVVGRAGQATDREGGGETAAESGSRESRPEEVVMQCVCVCVCVCVCACVRVCVCE